MYYHIFDNHPFPAIHGACLVSPDEIRATSMLLKMVSIDAMYGVCSGYDLIACELDDLPDPSGVSASALISGDSTQLRYNTIFKKRLLRATTFLFAGISSAQGEFKGIYETLYAKCGDVQNIVTGNPGVWSVQRTTLVAHLNWESWVQCISEKVLDFAQTGQIGALAFYEQDASPHPWMNNVATWSGKQFGVSGLTIPRVIFSFGDFEDADLQAHLDSRGIWSWRHHWSCHAQFGIESQLSELELAADVADAKESVKYLMV